MLGTLLQSVASVFFKSVHFHHTVVFAVITDGCLSLCVLCRWTDETSPIRETHLIIGSLVLVEGALVASIVDRICIVQQLVVEVFVVSLAVRVLIGFIVKEPSGCVVCCRRVSFFALEAITPILTPTTTFRVR